MFLSILLDLGSLGELNPRVFEYLAGSGLPGGAKTSCFCIFCCIWIPGFPGGGANISCFSRISYELTQTGSIWLGLGRYLRRIHPTNSGMPPGLQIRPKINKIQGFQG